MKEKRMFIFPVVFVILSFMTAAPLCGPQEEEVLVEELEVPATASLQEEYQIGTTCNDPSAAGPDTESSPLLEGVEYHITATGTATTLGDAQTDPDGVIQSGAFCNYSEGESMPADDYDCTCSDGIPVQDGAAAGSLIAVFLDIHKRPFGDPFVVGSDLRLTVPEGAAILALAVNDDDFTDNSGSYQVSIFEIRQPE